MSKDLILGTLYRKKRLFHLLNQDYLLMPQRVVQAQLDGVNNR